MSFYVYLNTQKHHNLNMRQQYITVTPAPEDSTRTCECLTSQSLCFLPQYRMRHREQGEVSELLLGVKDMCVGGREEICSGRQKCPNATPSAEASDFKGYQIDWTLLSPPSVPLGSHQLVPTQGPTLMRIHLMTK